jgi:Tol biopolymer transport system component
MPELREVFEMATKRIEPDLHEWKEQERRQRRHLRNRKVGAIALVATLGVIAAAVPASLSVLSHPEPLSSPTLGTHPPREGVYLLDTRTGMTTLVPKVNPLARDVAVSHDGTMVTYAAEDANGHQVVYVANIDGTNIRSLGRTGSTHGFAYQPSWSPDSSTIVYERLGAPFDSNMRVGNLFLVDVATGRTTQLTHLKPVVTPLWAMAPTFSPDGTSVLFQMPRGNLPKQSWDLWSVPVTGGEPTLVRRDAALGTFSPDGTRIAYVHVSISLPFGFTFTDLWVARADGSGARRLVRGHIDRPTWSPDGTQIAYEQGGGTIYVVDVMTGQATKVAHLDAWPSWVNDHTLIIDLGDF